LVSAISAALAQNYDQLFKRCYTECLPDEVIVSCSAVIARGIADKEDLVAAFKNRGNAFDDKGEYACTLEDYDEAVRINPLDADAIVGVPRITPSPAMSGLFWTLTKQ
jgi:hypothetical protein